MRNRNAFTLVELLVVVAIIVVLLSLLVPAMDRAIYQAELAVCGSRQKGLATSMIQYAAGSRRFYMYRYVQTPVSTRPNLIRIGGGSAFADDRPLLEQFSDLNTLVDPLGPAIKLDKVSNDKDPYIYTGVVLWAGWRYAGQRGMLKLGDRVTCTDKVTDPALAIPRTYRILASDLDWGFTDGRQIGTSHPDREGTMPQVTIYNQPPNGSLPPASVVNAPHTATSYEVYNAAARKPVDLNYAYDDGSVRRLDAVRRFDDRVKPLWLTDIETYEYSFWLPPAE